MKKIFSLFAALTLSVGLWAVNSVITYTASAQLATTEESGDEGYGLHVYAFLDANDQPLSFTQTFDELTKKGTITFNGELKTIDTGAFYACTEEVEIPSLLSIVIPEGVTTIRDAVFVSCMKLSSITIPASVTTIGNVAFGMLTSLTKFYVSWTTAPIPTFANSIFQGTNTPNATLYVPSGSNGLYNSTTPWSSFGSIKEYVSQAIKDAAIAAVNAKIAETDNDNIKAIATDAVIAINAAMTEEEVNSLKTLAIAAITSAKAAYGEGYDAGEAAVRAELPTQGYEGPAVIITKGEKVLTLFNPEKVEYQILEAD